MTGSEGAVAFEGAENALERDEPDRLPMRWYSWKNARDLLKPPSLRRPSPRRVGDLAQVLRCDRSNVSRLVDRAAARGLLERRATDLDGRVSLVQLTDEGDLLARRFITTLEDQLAHLLDDWSQQRQRSAVRLMNEIADTLDARRAAGPAH